MLEFIIIMSFFTDRQVYVMLAKDQCEQSSISLFDWNKVQIKLLCFGFVRKHLSHRNIQIDDIAKIVHKNCDGYSFDFGLIHSHCYGQVSNAQQYLNFLVNNKHSQLECLKYNQTTSVPCQDCSYQSLTPVDSYAIISLSLPTRYRTFEFTWIGKDIANPVVYDIQVLLCFCFII